MDITYKQIYYIIFIILFILFISFIDYYTQILSQLNIYKVMINFLKNINTNNTDILGGNIDILKQDYEQLKNNYKLTKNKEEEEITNIDNDIYFLNTMANMFKKTIEINKNKNDEDIIKSKKTIANLFPSAKDVFLYIKDNNIKDNNIKDNNIKDNNKDNNIKEYNNLDNLDNNINNNLDNINNNLDINNINNNNININNINNNINNINNDINNYDKLIKNYKSKIEDLDSNSLDLINYRNNNIDTIEGLNIEDIKKDINSYKTNIFNKNDKNDKNEKNNRQIDLNKLYKEKKQILTSEHMCSDTINLTKKKYDKYDGLVLNINNINKKEDTLKLDSYNNDVYSSMTCLDDKCDEYKDIHSRVDCIS